MGSDQNLKLKLTLAIAAILLFSHSGPGSSHDSSRMAMIEKLITQHVWWTEGSRYFNAVDMVMDRGHFYSDKPPVFALYSAAVAHPLKFVTSFDTAAGRRIFYFFITITSSGLCLVGLCWLMRRALRHFRVPEASWNRVILGVVTGTCVLPTCLTYVTHTAEALLLFGTFLALLYYADQPKAKHVYWMGLLTGLNIMVHPFIGGMYSILTGGYFLIRRKYLDLVRFGVCVVLLGLATLGLNQILFGTFRPYYTMPEKYLFLVTDGKKVYPSGFMLDPTVQGLTESMVAERFAEQGYPDALKERTIERLRKYKQNVQTNLGFAASNWMKWDFLFFNPLVIFCIFLAVRGILRADRTRRLLGLWILGGVFAMYVSSIFQRSMPGGSFGNRYLIAALPPLFVFAATELKKPLDHKWFLALYVVTLAGALVGSTHPWHTPSSFYAWSTMPIYTLLSVVSLGVAWASGRRSSADDPFMPVYQPGMAVRIACFAAFAAWFAAQGAAYYREMPGQLDRDWPRLLAMAVCVPIFMIWHEGGRKGLEARSGATIP